MYDNYNYPPGADNEQAPWNQEPVPEREFDVMVSQTLSKSVIITTNDYEPEIVNERHNGIFEFNAITDNTDWEADFHENDYHTPEQLILLFKRYLEAELGGKQSVPKSPTYIKKLIEECDGWCVDETEFCEE